MSVQCHHSDAAHWPPKSASQLPSGVPPMRNPGGVHPSQPKGETSPDKSPFALTPSLWTSAQHPWCSAGHCSATTQAAGHSLPSLMKDRSTFDILSHGFVYCLPFIKRGFEQDETGCFPWEAGLYLCGVTLQSQSPCDKLRTSQALGRGRQLM